MMGLLICKNGLIWARSGCSIEFKFHQHQYFTMQCKSNSKNWNLNWRMKVKCCVPVLWSVYFHNQTIQSHPNFTNTHSLPCSSHPMVGLWIWCHFQNCQILDPCPLQGWPKALTTKGSTLYPIIKGSTFHKIICMYVYIYVCIYV